MGGTPRYLPLWPGPDGRGTPRYLPPPKVANPPPPGPDGGEGVPQDTYPSVKVPTPPRDRTAYGVLDMPRSVCLLRSRRGTFLWFVQSFGESTCIRCLCISLHLFSVISSMNSVKCIIPPEPDTRPTKRTIRYATLRYTTAAGLVLVGFPQTWSKTRNVHTNYSNWDREIIHRAKICESTVEA